jgi:short-subunit dehydrogenase
MKTIKNKIALVTGASAGIGKETVKQLLEDGAIVYAAARRVDHMKDLEKLGAKILSLDVTDENSVLAAIAKINSKTSGVDILVNNAGYGSYGAVEDVPLSEAKRQFDVNIFGLARLTQLVLPSMRKNKYGKIINISSMGGKMYSPLGAWYHATKHALEGWSDCLRIETKAFGIDVIIIEPGGIASEWGGIALENALKTSGNTAYSKITQGFAKMMKDTYENKKASPPTVISDLISKAVNAKRPKTRYHAGYMSGIALCSRWLLSDKIFDKFIMSMAK